MARSPADRAVASAAGRVAGLLPRRLAADAVADVITRSRTLDQALAAALKHADAAAMPPSDRAFLRLIATTTLRRHGQIRALMDACLDRPLPRDRGRLDAILATAVAQLVFLEGPPHAIINAAVELTRSDRGARRFDKLANAVLRRIDREGAGMIAAADPYVLNVPAWLRERWSAAYGVDTARKIGLASLAEPALDLSVRSDPAGWAARLGGFVLPTGSVRLAASGRIDALEGYDEGAWWIQDAAAALPARLLGDVAGRSIADLCAAPGGKTAQLAAAGAHVTAVDSSSARIATLQGNLLRLRLDARIVTADAAGWSPGTRFDGVLLDAPCTATGTIRRHPDILHIRKPPDVTAMQAIQARLLENAARLVAPGGHLVYCTCSLEPEEGEEHVAAFLGRNADFSIEPVDPAEIGGLAGLVATSGTLRTLPHMLPLEPPKLSGLDGFFAARLRRAPC